MSSGDPFTYSSRSAYRINHLRLIKDRLEISQFVYIYSGVYKYIMAPLSEIVYIFIEHVKTKKFQDLVGNCSQNKKWPPQQMPTSSFREKGRQGAESVPLK